MDKFMEHLITFATDYGIRIVGAILILIIGRIAAGWIRRLVRKGLEKRGTDPAIIGFVAGLSYYLVLIFTVLAVLSKFGVETASFVAVLGAAGFAIGFAMQGSLGNFAAGIMLLVFRPYNIGDYVEVSGVSGTVREMGLFVTNLTTPDNVRVIVPNGKIFGDIIKNYSAEDLRRVDLVFGIGYGSSIEQATATLKELMAADPRILAEPEPQIAVNELADSSVNFVARPWVKKEDYWAVRFDLTERVKAAFDEKGIEIPFPQVVMHSASA
jgi:small conductance mechanosensitive channel